MKIIAKQNKIELTKKTNKALRRSFDEKEMKLIQFNLNDQL